MNDNKLDIKKNYNNAIAGLTAQIIFTLCNVLLIYFTFSEQILKGQDFIANLAKVILIISLITSVVKIILDFKNEQISIYIDYLHLKAEREKQNIKIRQLSESAIQLEMLMGIVLNFLVVSKSRRAIDIYRNGNIAAVKEELSKYVKDFLFHRLKELFATSIFEKFSVAIYLYDSSQNILWDFLSKKSFFINPKEDSGRDWNVDAASHVAMCFKYQLEFIHPNLQQAFTEIKAENQQGLKPDDEKKYKSCITLPLFFRRNNEQKEIAGVFCITSDHYNTFTNLNLEDSVYSSKIKALRMIADIVADNLALHYNNDANSIRKNELQVI